jgi:hypothetical protein
MLAGKGWSREKREEKEVTKVGRMGRGGGEEGASRERGGARGIAWWQLRVCFVEVEVD